MLNGKIKILHVIGIMDYGGAETMIMNLYRKLDHTRFEFDFLIHRDREGKYDNEIVSLGGKIYSIPEYKIYNAHSYRVACQKFFQKHPEFDIVHGHIESCAAIYLKEAKKAGMYTIAHCHSTGYTKLLPRILYDSLTLRTRKVAEYFFACSRQAGINRFGKKIVSSDKFQVFNNGIDASQYVYSKERHEKLKKNWDLKDKIIIGHVGRMSKEKNHEFLVHVFAKICEIKKEAVLVLVGDGPEREKIKKEVRKLEIEDKVIFAGNRSDVADLMNLFDIFIFPSIYEGLGIALIEAQAAGLPCIVSEAIVREAILTSEVKKLSLENSFEQWALESLKMLETTERKSNYNIICKNGFDIFDTIRKLEAFYEKHSVKEIR